MLVTQNYIDSHTSLFNYLDSDTSQPTFQPPPSASQTYVSNSGCSSDDVSKCAR